LELLSNIFCLKFLIIASIIVFKVFLFLFLALSLAVLEGIAISSNPDYKVLGSTYPWIARKVLTDSSPKLKSSLQALLYEVNEFFFLFSFVQNSFNYFSHCFEAINAVMRMYLISQQKEMLNILCQP
jgi:predicted unusual protein kinase regulating ubiquinone biosynthesis (AarF/ABC1/UbiB family)